MRSGVCGVHSSSYVNPDVVIATLFEILLDEASQNACILDQRTPNQRLSKELILTPSAKDKLFLQTKEMLRN